MIRSAAAIPPAALMGASKDAGVPAEVAMSVETALERALKAGAKRVLICGSLYLAGAVLRDGAA